MRVHVVVMGFNYADALEDCLASIAAQTYSDVNVVVVDDASPDVRCADITRRWCAEHDATAIVNDVNRGTVYNAWHAVKAAGPANDDVVVFLDGDDRFPHPGCLDRIVAEYESDPDGVWMTYGNYASDPPDPGCPSVAPYPADVVADRSFRSYPIQFNHPLTFRGFLWHQLDESDMRRADGSWYRSIYDQVLMYPALEMAGPHYRMIPDVIYTYNTTHPTPDNGQDRCADDYADLAAKPKAPPMVLSDGALCMEWEYRCDVILDYMARYGLRDMVETGTADGATARTVVASTMVDGVVTIEADRERWTVVAPRLADQPKIHAAWGESPDAIYALAAGGLLPTRALWWLDAHAHLEDVGGDPSKVTPIVDELRFVLTERPGDVILVDDARLFGTYPGYPTIHGVCDLVALLAPDYDVSVRHDIIRIVPKVAT